jgi:hypothetical protein
MTFAAHPSSQRAAPETNGERRRAREGTGGCD